jgi:hypothetical protein
MLFHIDCISGYVCIASVQPSLLLEVCIDGRLSLNSSLFFTSLCSSEGHYLNSTLMQTEAQLTKHIDDKAQN